MIIHFWTSPAVEMMYTSSPQSTGEGASLFSRKFLILHVLFPESEADGKIDSP